MLFCTSSKAGLCDQFFIVCYLFILTVRITAKAITDFIKSRCYRAYQSEEMVNFSWWSALDMDSGSLFHFSRHCGI